MSATLATSPAGPAASPRTGAAIRVTRLIKHFGPVEFELQPGRDRVDERIVQAAAEAADR